MFYFSFLSSSLPSMPLTVAGTWDTQPEGQTDVGRTQGKSGGETGVERAGSWGWDLCLTRDSGLVAMHYYWVAGESWQCLGPKNQP